MRLHAVSIRAAIPAESHTTKIEGVLISWPVLSRILLNIGDVSFLVATQIEADFRSRRPSISSLELNTDAGEGSFYSRERQILRFVCYDSAVIAKLTKAGAPNDPTPLYRYGIQKLGELRQRFGQ